MPPHPLLAQAFQLSAAGRNPEAILIVNQLVAQGEPEAMHILAEMRWRGGMVAQDPRAGRALFERASEAGHGPARIIATNLLANGVAGSRDWPAALARLKAEAKFDPRRKDMLALLGKMALTPDGDPLRIPEAQPLSASPEVLSFPRLFTATECAWLRRLADPGFGPSTVYNAQRRLVQDPIRTSDGSTLHWQIEDPVVHALNRRLAVASGTKADQGEAMQILRYKPGQRYHRHLDFVGTPENQRIKTALVYLNEDYEGGETLFVQTGLKVKGRAGDAIVFRNATPDRRSDPMSEHEGLPVTRGVKYLASRWIRENRWQP